MALLAWLAVQQPIPADELPASELPASELESQSEPQSELRLPEYPSVENNLAQTRSVPYQEHRIGGRLEQVTVIRENGFTEIYQNNRADTVWSAEENEIGEVPNMRQWVIRTW